MFALSISIFFFVGTFLGSGWGVKLVPDLELISQKLSIFRVCWVGDVLLSRV